MEPEQKPRERSFIRELVPDWRPTRKHRLWTVRIVIVLVVVLGLLSLIGLSFGITLWDWAKLLIVPAVIAAGGLWFNRQQQEHLREDNRQQRERELEIADWRAQDEALQAYLDQMFQLLSDEKHPLHKAQLGDSLSTIARVRTLTVLRKLNGERKGSVVRFLYEAGLIGKERRVVDLQGADLSGADLRLADLQGTDLGQVNLQFARLEWAHLQGVDLHQANLQFARLEFANLQGANLANVRLEGARLRHTKLEGAKLAYAQLQGADLTSADLKEVDLDFADFSKGDLFAEVEAGLRWFSQDLNEEDLHLQQANLQRARLDGAYMSSSTNITREQLASCDSFAGAVMPDGEIASGKYSSREFTPACSFVVDQGWKLSKFGFFKLFIATGPEGRYQLRFARLTSFFDFSNPSEFKEVLELRNTGEWLSWFQEHPNLETSKPVEVSVGGARGMRIDVTVTTTPETYPT